MQEVLTSTEGTPARVTVRKMTLINNDFVSMLKHLKNNGEYRFIIDCKADTVRKFLYAARNFMRLLVNQIFINLLSLRRGVFLSTGHNVELSLMRIG